MAKETKRPKPSRAHKPSELVHQYREVGIPAVAAAARYNASSRAEAASSHAGEKQQSEQRCQSEIHQDRMTHSAPYPPGRLREGERLAVFVSKCSQRGEVIFFRQ